MREVFEAFSDNSISVLPLWYGYGEFENMRRLQTNYKAFCDVCDD